MYFATLVETFQATHALDNLRPQPHPHDWVVKLILAGAQLKEPGILMNYFELKPLLYQALPHGKHLNDCFSFAPTAENLARHFYETLKPVLPGLFAVSVGEFESFMCTYQPDELLQSTLPTAWL